MGSLVRDEMVGSGRRHSPGRRSWSVALSAVLVVAPGVLTAARGAPTATIASQSAVRFDPWARPLDGPAVVPDSAWSMAAGPDGSVYVVDQARQEVLRWSPGQGFSDVAGDGHKGFSGDGGPATKATFDFSWASAVAVGRDGTLYISDTGNGRIRAVRPDRVVQTVIGGGRGPLTGTRAPARAVLLSNWPQGFGLTIGPGGELYVGAGAGVYRLIGEELVRVVGVDPTTYIWPRPPYRYEEPLPVRFDGASRLAFDGKGDLLVGDDGPYDAYELTASGARRPVGNIRGDGSVAPMAEAPDGDVVIGTGTDGFEWFSPSGKIAQVADLGPWAAKGSGLDKVLYGRGYFRPSDGIAVSTAGDVFIDTNAGNGWTSVSAVAEVTPSGDVRAIWRS